MIMKMPKQLNKTSKKFNEMIANSERSLQAMSILDYRLHNHNKLMSTRFDYKSCK
jgi:hypothetical protein